MAMHVLPLQMLLCCTKEEELFEAVMRIDADCAVSFGTQ